MVGRTPGDRIRSKTADLSDLLRGHRPAPVPIPIHLSPAALSLSSPPHAPSADAKPRRKLPLFGRRRKSDSVSQSPATSPGTEFQRYARALEDVPPVPKVPDDASESVGYNTTILPPLNVSPSSFGTLAEFPPRTMARSAPTQNGFPSFLPSPTSPTRAAPTLPSHFKSVTPSTQRASAVSAPLSSSPASALAPISTVAPPKRQERDRDREHEWKPRAHVSQPPLARPLRPQKSMSFEFARWSRDRTVQPTITVSPPRADVLANAVGQDASASSGILRGAEGSVIAGDAGQSRIGASRQSHKLTPLVVTSRTASPAAVTPVPASPASIISRASTSSLLPSPSSMRFPIPPSAASTSVSISNYKDREKEGKERLVKHSTLSGAKRNSDAPRYSAPPRTKPPSDPLPDPPEGELPSIPSLPSVTAPRRHTVLRSRANTVASTPVASPAERRRSQEKENGGNRMNVAASAGGGVGGSAHETARRSMQSAQEVVVEEVTWVADADLHIELEQDEVNMSADQLRSLVVTQRVLCTQLAEHVRTLSDQRNVLERRVEMLEHEARKREREIKGLRWLVINGTNTGTGTSAESALPPSSVSAPHLQRERERVAEMEADAFALASPGSTEEGLHELGATMSDFVMMTESPLVGREREREAAVRRMRRSYTVSDGLGFVPGVKSPARQSQQTGSPILPPAIVVPGGPSQRGLGLEGSMPAIPSEGDSLFEGDELELPSLTAANTASSGLSAIPETPREGMGFEGREAERERERAKREREARRASRALKRISASSDISTLSTSPSVPAYTDKVARSPAMPQMLGKSVEESEMDAILRRLRAFAGPG